MHVLSYRSNFSVFFVVFLMVCLGFFAKKNIIQNISTNNIIIGQTFVFLHEYVIMLF